jgi:hypothetical protein
MFNFNKNDPILEAARGVIEENHKRRAVETRLFEELGIGSLKALPFEAHHDFKETMNEMVKQVLAGKTVDEAYTTEMTKSRLASYVKKASKSATDNAAKGPPPPSAWGNNDDTDKTIAKRGNGIARAVDKLSGKAKVNAIEEGVSTSRDYKSKDSGVSTSRDWSKPKGDYKDKGDSDLGSKFADKGKARMSFKSRLVKKGKDDRATDVAGLKEADEKKKIEELSARTLNKYSNAAGHSETKLAVKGNRSEKDMKKLSNRGKGVKNAADRIEGKFSTKKKEYRIDEMIAAARNRTALASVEKEIAESLEKKYNSFNDDAARDSWVQNLSEEQIAITERVAENNTNINEFFGAINKAKQAIQASRQSVGAKNSGAADTATSAAAPKPAPTPAPKQKTGWEAGTDAFAAAKDALETKASRLGGATKSLGSAKPVTPFKDANANNDGAHNSGARDTASYGGRDATPPSRSKTHTDSGRSDDGRDDDQISSGAKPTQISSVERPTQGQPKGAQPAQQPGAAAEAQPEKNNKSIQASAQKAGELAAKTADFTKAPTYQKNPYAGAVGKKADAMSQHDNKDMYEEVDPRFLSLSNTYRRMLKD